MNSLAQRLIGSDSRASQCTGGTDFIRILAPLLRILGGDHIFVLEILRQIFSHCGPTTGVDPASVYKLHLYSLLWADILEVA